MPYYDPVVGFDERKQAFPKAVELLDTFRKAGYKYRNNDLRWRHLKKRGGHIKLIDLGCLEQLKAVETIDITH